MISNRTPMGEPNPNYLNAIDRDYHDYAEPPAYDPYIAACVVAVAPQPNGPEAIAAADVHTPQTHGLIRDRETAALLIAALAR